MTPIEDLISGAVERTEAADLKDEFDGFFVERPGVRTVVSTGELELVKPEVNGKPINGVVLVRHNDGAGNITERAVLRKMGWRDFAYCFVDVNGSGPEVKKHEFDPRIIDPEAMRFRQGRETAMSDEEHFWFRCVIMAGEPIELTR